MSAGSSVRPGVGFLVLIHCALFFASSGATELPLRGGSSYPERTGGSEVRVAGEERPLARAGAVAPAGWDLTGDLAREMAAAGGVSSGGRSSPPSPRVSRRKAFFLSLLLPGLGQRANGHYGRAKVFMGMEAAIWLTAGGFRLVGEMREDDYRQFAAIRAGVDLSQDSEDYYQLVADYRSSDDYNIEIRRDARAIYPYDRQQQLRYIEQHSLGGEAAWSWPDEDTQWEFRYLRHDALSAKRTAVLLTGWAVVNRIVSAVEAARSAGGGEGPAEERAAGCRIDMDMICQGDSPALRLRLGRSF